MAGVFCNLRRGKLRGAETETGESSKRCPLQYVGSSVSADNVPPISTCAHSGLPSDLSVVILRLVRNSCLLGGLFLQRYGIGFVLGRLLVQQGDSFAARGGMAGLTLSDNLLSLMLRHTFLVGAAVRPKRRTLERDPANSPRERE